MSLAARSVTATFAAAAAAIGAGDVMGGAQIFLGIGPHGGGAIMITGAVLEIETTGLQSGEGDYRLELYSVTPPSALADNAAFDIPEGDRAAHIGTIELGTPVDKGSTCKIETDGINKQVTVPPGGNLFAYLVTVAGFTATAVDRNVTLTVIPL